MKASQQKEGAAIALTNLAASAAKHVCSQSAVLLVAREESSQSAAFYRSPMGNIRLLAPPNASLAGAHAHQPAARLRGRRRGAPHGAAGHVWRGGEAHRGGDRARGAGAGGGHAARGARQQ
eukprot:1186508-Prorocentrum_minimum.AAC.1